MPEVNKWTDSTAEDVSHQAISSYFIGPQCENLPFFRKNVNKILDELAKARKAYFKDDGAFITDSIQKSQTFQDCTRRTEAAVCKISELLGKHSLPFWSPRYEAHMWYVLRKMIAPNQ